MRGRAERAGRTAGGGRGAGEGEARRSGPRRARGARGGAERRAGARARGPRPTLLGRARGVEQFLTLAHGVEQHEQALDGLGLERDLHERLDALLVLQPSPLVPAEWARLQEHVQQHRERVGGVALERALDALEQLARVELVHQAAVVVAQQRRQADRLVPLAEGALGHGRGAGGGAPARCAGAESVHRFMP